MVVLLLLSTFDKNFRPGAPRARAARVRARAPSVRVSDFFSNSLRVGVPISFVGLILSGDGGVCRLRLCCSLVGPCVCAPVCCGCALGGVSCPPTFLLLLLSAQAQHLC